MYRWIRILRAGDNGCWYFKSGELIEVGQIRNVYVTGNAPWEYFHVTRRSLSSIAYPFYSKIRRHPSSWEYLTPLELLAMVTDE